MDKKINPWMMATTFLLGIIIGFGTAKIMPGNINAELEARTLAADTKEPETTNTAPQVPTVSTAIDYTSIPQEKNSDGNWIMGSKNAKVVIQEFSDFQCPFCHQYFSETFPDILKNYILNGKVAYVYYNYPLSFHPQAPTAALAALCAGDENKFWEMHDALFDNQNIWSPQSAGETKTFETLAEMLKLDTGKFKQCLASGKYNDQIKKDTAAGEKNGISGTPSFMINGTKVVGAQPYSALESIIEEALKK